MHRPWDLGHRAEPRVDNITANRELGLTRDALNIGVPHDQCYDSQLLASRPSNDSMTLSITRFRVMLLTSAVTGCLMCLLPINGTAQTPTRSSLPRVGTIKDYPATGLMVGCGNLYFYKAADANSTTANYVFLSRGDGSHAWMNLNGRDVRLLQFKSGVGANRRVRGYFYRYRGVRITVEFEEYTPPPGETDHTHKMKITLRRGRTVRIVQAVGGSDC